VGVDTEGSAAVNDELPDRLRVTAEEYEPDRDRMWSRVSEGMREPRVQAVPVRTGWRIPQLSLATGAAVVLIGAIVFFGHAMGIGPVVGPTPEPPAAGPGTRTAAPTDPETSGDTTSSASTSEDAEEATGSEETTTGAEETTSGADPDGAAPEWLWTDGSVDEDSGDFWSEAKLTLKNEVPLTDLNVELRVAVGEGLESTGSWNTAGTYFADAQVAEEDGFLVYRWTLREGQVLPAGEYTLAGQFNHGSGPRSADDDVYSFEAETEAGDQGRAEGDFA
jgi:hypothetical protein